MNNKLDVIIDSIWRGEFQSSINELMEYLNSIITEIHAFDMDINVFNQILTEITNAIQRKDYIFLVDLIEFELKPIVKTKLN